MPNLKRMRKFYLIFEKAPHCGTFSYKLNWSHCIELLRINNINYVDKSIKELNNDKTIGIVIVKKEDKFVMEYCTDNRIFTATYELQKI